jgi:cytochrome subunit of sulfide dehydrogenase
MQPGPRVATFALAITGALAAGHACAQDAAALRDRSLAATCAACHGTDGRAIGGAAWPALAGMPAAKLAAQMQAFKRGERTGTVMPQLAKGFSDAQIDRLAAWFAAQPGS